MSEPKVLEDLLGGGWKHRVFQPFREGVGICHLLQGSPAVALLRYEAGASVPRHRHPGLETVLILDGSQHDERGHYTTGSYVLNPPGSLHSVWSERGCVVLIHWQRPVEFVPVPEPAK